MSNTNEHAEEPEINEILLDDMQETVLPTQPRRQKKHFVIPCIPAIYSSLLMSAGQVLSSLILDDFAWSLLIGALVILVGMALNFISDWKASPQAA